MGDLGSIPGLGRLPWRRERLPPIPAWEIPWTEEWRATVNGVRKSWTPLSDFHFLPWCELLLSLVGQVLAQYTPVLGPYSLRHSAILPFECPLCRKKIFAQFFAPVKVPLSFPFLQIFFLPLDRGLLEAGNDSRPASHFLPTTWPSHGAFRLTACGVVTAGPKREAAGWGLALDSWEASGIFWRQTGLCEQPAAWNRVNRGVWQAVPWALSLPEACGFKALIAEIRATLFECSASKGQPSPAQVMAAPSRGPQPGLEKRWLQGPGPPVGLVFPFLLNPPWAQKAAPLSHFSSSVSGVFKGFSVSSN